MQVADIALPYLTKPEDHGTDAADVQGEDGGSDGGGDDEDEDESGSDDDDDITAASAPDLSPSTANGMAGQQQQDGIAALPCHRQQLAQLRGSDVQVVSSGCWTSMKEVGLMVGSLAQRLPMPGDEDLALQVSMWAYVRGEKESGHSLRASTYETRSELIRRHPLSKTLNCFSTHPCSGFTYSIRISILHPEIRNHACG